MSQPLEGEVIQVHVSISLNSDGTVNLSFTDIEPENLPALLCSVGTEEFQRTLVQQFNDDVRARREHVEFIDPTGFPCEMDGLP